MGQHVENIRDCRDARGKRDHVGAKPDITSAVPALVVVKGNFLSGPEDARLACRKDKGPDGSMGFHLFKLVRGQLTSLQ